MEWKWSGVECSAVEWRIGMGSGISRMMQNEWSEVEWSVV